MAETRGAELRQLSVPPCYWGAVLGRPNRLRRGSMDYGFTFGGGAFATAPVNTLALRPPLSTTLGVEHRVQLGDKGGLQGFGD